MSSVKRRVNSTGRKRITVRTAPCRSEVGKNTIDNRLPIDPRGQHAFDVFHDKGDRPQSVDNPNVFSIEKVPRVIRRDVVFYPSVSGATDE